MTPMFDVLAAGVLLAIVGLIGYTLYTFTHIR